MTATNAGAEHGGGLTFKCKCGAFEAKLKGKPVTTLNCQCHSCVAAARAIESKPSYDGFSIFDGGGVAYASFGWKNITFATDMASDEMREKVGFVKVGEQGKIIRSYCTGCGTMLGVHRDISAGFNRRAIFNHDGSPYVPAKPVTNIMAKYAFDPSNVPAPKSSIIPVGMMLSYLPSMLGFRGKVNPKESALFPRDVSKVEVVPIAWK